MNPERFDRAIQALVGAYMNDTLVPALCTACAVGNIVAAGYGEKLTRVDGRVRSPIENDAWSSHFICGQPKLNGEYSEKRLQKGLENIEVTGYSKHELMRIEGAFMDAVDSWGAKIIGDSHYKGLMAAVDVLCQIEGIADADEYKALFAGKELVGA